MNKKFDTGHYLAFCSSLKLYSQPFLVANKQLYIRVCPSVGGSVRPWSVRGPSVSRFFLTAKFDWKLPRITKKVT